MIEFELLCSPAFNTDSAHNSKSLRSAVMVSLAKVLSSLLDICHVSVVGVEPTCHQVTFLLVISERVYTEILQRCSNLLSYPEVKIDGDGVISH